MSTDEACAIVDAVDFLSRVMLDRPDHGGETQRDALVVAVIVLLRTKPSAALYLVVLFLFCRP